ncbi:MAG TPA: hypothetical protein VFI96_00455 [Longimicrobiaceae bacterium]|nr:hypothetical protein [Longimicrobiaceae bacterium]
MSADRRRQSVGTASTENPEGSPWGRQEVGGAASSHEEPPHVTENAEGAPVQKDVQGEGDAPVIPPNASGKDRFAEEKHARPIRPESAYDRRPEEDKNWDPGDRT